jgi:vacuolar-type H+-ATPase subunit I/STV1
MLRNLLRYPDPVNENAARLVAAGVVVLVAGYLLTGSWVVLALLTYGFVARVLSGPTFSPWAQVVNRFLVPWLSIPSKPVPGPPKRFAQGIGAVLSVGAAVAHVAGFDLLAAVLVVLIGIAATLESVFGFCVGCWIFARLMDVGLVPASVCEVCNNLPLRGHDAALNTESSRR